MTHKNFIGGHWIASRGGATFGDENPAHRGSNLGSFQSSTVDDVACAIDAAAEALRSWRRTTVADRQRYVAAFLTLLKQSREEIARIVTLENGKTIKEARAEVDSALVEGGYHLQQVAGFFDRAGVRSSKDLTTWVKLEPAGVVGIISPWNFPMNVMCRKTLPALLTGNTVVFKPATFTPWSGIFMASLFERAGLPTGVFNCVTGLGSSIGNAIVDDPRVRAVSFTGSTAVGKKIQARAATNLTRTQLELGGKNALIVMDDADLTLAVDASITAGFSNAGQWCTSTSRVLLQRRIAAPFLDALVARSNAMVVGDGLDESTDMGPVAGPQQHDDVMAAIERAKADGAHIAAGGISPDSDGYFVRPTVMTQVAPQMAAFRDEIFGPVLALCEFDSLGDALDLANNSVYGLSSAIYTTNRATADAYVDAIEAGLAHVNVHTGYKEPSLPFGGIKQSGAGLPENSETGLEFFVDRKAVYERLP
ncbi:MAG TPA: aldehyde dehydrogenase family protein [Vicinamibacterales bacterium]|nr:aldehyde dehydrogenase family protein [Vicinamibacterales bacterium]